VAADIIDAVAAERSALADLYATLTPAQLDTPSLCEGWTVRDIAAHLSTLWNVSLPAMTMQVLRARGSFPRAVRRVTSHLATRPVEHLVEGLRANAHNPKHPPLMPLAPLTDAIVHGEDVRRPLGVVRHVPAGSVRMALGFVTSGRDFGGFFLPRGRLRGLKLVATDQEWSWGSGDVVSGPALSLLLGALGRHSVFDELSGAAPLLAARL
jgi:uncharacterized protein (TIGR03083 family)